MFLFVNAASGVGWQDNTWVARAYSRLRTSALDPKIWLGLDQVGPLMRGLDASSD